MKLLKIAAAVSALIAAGLASASAQTIKIGSKNFTEQFIVAELYAAALENAGFKVDRKINLGGTLVALVMGSTLRLEVATGDGYVRASQDPAYRDRLFRGAARIAGLEPSEAG